jgi:hypothetical protein
MTEEECKEFHALMEKAMKYHAEKLLEQKIKRGEKMVISVNGVIKIVDPRDIKRRSEKL